jgi:uncharacterized protein YgiM (DUF1202 family)
VNFRRRITIVACLLAIALVGGVVPVASPVSARSRPHVKVSLTAYSCPAGMDEQNLVSVDCAPLTSGFDVEIISIEGTQPDVTLAEAQNSGNIFRWELMPSNAETDNWGIRQRLLPTGATKYLIQGETVTVKQTALYDFRFTTSEGDPNIDLFFFVFFPATDGVIIPPAEEASPTDTAPQTGEADAEASSAIGGEQPASTGAFARTASDATEQRTVQKGSAPVRLAADPRASIVEMLGEGAVVRILSGPTSGGNGSWYEVSTPSGAIGWLEAGAFEEPAVSSAADSAWSGKGNEHQAATTSLADSASTRSASEPVAAASSEPLKAGDRAIVHDPPLNLRAEPSVNGEVIDALDEGQLLRIEGEATTADGTTWYPVVLLPDAATRGYVADGFIQPIGFLPGEMVVIDSDGANVRSKPSISGTVLLEAAGGQTGQVLAEPQSADGYEWYEVDFGSQQIGWVAGSLLSLGGEAISVASEPVAGGFRVGSWVTVVDPPINLRSGPGVDALAVEALDEGPFLLVQAAPERVDGHDWYLVDYRGVQGYAAGEFLDGGFRPAEEVRVFDGPIYVRSAPEPGDNIVTSLEQGETATVVSAAPLMGDGHLWIQVRTADGALGYVAIDFIEPVA